MQLRKQNWKRIAKTKPCLKCGRDHESKTCLTKNGRRQKAVEL